MPATMPRTNKPPDNPEAPPFEELPGNHVTLRVAPGMFVLYAHMMPGSVRVHVGERVHRGQLLGRLGNSGNSATPHLHLQVQITRSFAGDGLPFVFDRFRFLGQITEPFSDETLGLQPNGQLQFARSPSAGYTPPRDAAHRKTSCDFRVDEMSRRRAILIGLAVTGALALGAQAATDQGHAALQHRPTGMEE